MDVILSPGSKAMARQSACCSIIIQHKNDTESMRQWILSLRNDGGVIGGQCCNLKAGKWKGLKIPKDHLDSPYLLAHGVNSTSRTQKLYSRIFSKLTILVQGLNKAKEANVILSPVAAEAAAASTRWWEDTVCR